MHLGTWEMSVPTVTSPQSPLSHEGAAGPKRTNGVGTAGGGPGPTGIQWVGSWAKPPAGSVGAEWSIGGLQVQRAPHSVYFLRVQEFYGLE